MPRREHWNIVGAILEAIHEHTQAAGSDARVTNVALRANISYDRLTWYLEELARDGLIVREGRMPQLTPKGHEFLRLYHQWARTLASLGLSPHGYGIRTEAVAAEVTIPGRAAYGPDGPT